MIDTQIYRYTDSYKSSTAVTLKRGQCSSLNPVVDAKIPPFELLFVRRIPPNLQTQAITTVLDHPPELENETSLEN